MKLAQRKILWLARLMLGLVLFAQGIVAASACLVPAASPVHAFAVTQHDDEAAPCHDEEIPNANACLSHCTQSDQISADQHSVPIAAPASVIAWASIQPQTQSIRLFSHERPAPGSEPPIPIRFCSLLN